MHTPIADNALGRLPARLRAVWVCAGNERAAWLGEALADDRVCAVELRHAATFAAGIALLREGDCDAILVEHSAGLDGREFAAACRGGAFEEPLLVLGHEPIADFETSVYEAGADAYVLIPQTSVRGLLWTLARAYERRELLRENRLLRQNERRRLHWEQVEATRLLAEQRAMLDELTSPGRTISKLAATSTAETTSSPVIRRRMNVSGAKRQFDKVSTETLHEDYRELLRGYVIMGTGNMSGELRGLALRLKHAGIGARQAMLLHLQAVEELVKGLGQRSSRHLLSRADLLILELMIEMADSSPTSELAA